MKIKEFIIKHRDIISNLIFILIVLLIFFSLYPEIVRTIECANCTGSTPVIIGNFSLIPVLIEIGIILLLVFWVIYKYHPENEKEEIL